VEWNSEDWRSASAGGNTSEGASFRSAVVTTSKEHDFTAQVPLEKLTPATLYRYRVLTASLEGDGEFQEKATGRLKTAAPAEAPESVRFLWGGDLGGQAHCRDAAKGYAIFERMREAAPEFAVLLGDLIYSDDRCPAPPNVSGSDFLASTLDEYRAKHRYQRGDPALQWFLAEVPVYAIWDDHEVRNNFSGPYDPLMPVGRQALLEYWPIGTSADDPHRLYRKVRRGADLELFILDTRQYRSRNADPDGAEKTMLGAGQRDWLVEGLVASTATWKVIATSVPLSIPKEGTQQMPGNDSWTHAPDGTGFLAELRAVVKALRTRGVRNVVWLAADVHFAQVNEYDPDGDHVADFYEFVAGPLAAASGQAIEPDPALRPTTMYSGAGFANFGLVAVQGKTLRLDIVDESGIARFVHTFVAQ
jgi:alkaline phosphatase D